MYTTRPPTPDDESIFPVHENNKPKILKMRLQSPKNDKPKLFKMRPQSPENGKPILFKMRPQSPETEGWDTSLNTSIDLDSPHEKPQLKSKDKSGIPILKPSLVQTHVTIAAPSQLTDLKLNISAIPDQSISPLILNKYKKIIALSSTPSPLAPSIKILNTPSEDVKIRTQLKYTGKEFVPSAFLISKVSNSTKSQDSLPKTNSINKKISSKRLSDSSRTGNYEKNPPLNTFQPPFKFPVMHYRLPSDDRSSPEARDTKFYRLDTSDRNTQKGTRSSHEEFNKRNKYYQQPLKNYPNLFISTLPHAKNEFPPLANFNTFNNPPGNPNFPSRHKKTFSREFSSVILEQSNMRSNKKNSLFSNSGSQFAPSISSEKPFYQGLRSSFNNGKEQAPLFSEHSACQSNNQITPNQKGNFSSLNAKDKNDYISPSTGKSKNAKKLSSNSFPILSVSTTHDKKEDNLNKRQSNNDTVDLALVDRPNLESKIPTNTTDYKPSLVNLSTIDESGPREELGSAPDILENEPISDEKASFGLSNDGSPSIKKHHPSLNLSGIPESNIPEIDDIVNTKTIVSESNMVVNSSDNPSKVNKVHLKENPWVKNNLDYAHNSIEEISNSKKINTFKSEGSKSKPSSLHDFTFITSLKEDSTLTENSVPFVSHSGDTDFINELTPKFNTVSISDSKLSAIDKMVSHLDIIAQTPSAQTDNIKEILDGPAEIHYEDALKKTNAGLDSDFESNFSFLNLQEPRELYTLSENSFSPRLNEESTVFNEASSCNLSDKTSNDVLLDNSHRANQTKEQYELNKSRVFPENSISSHVKRKLHHIPEALEVDSNNNQTSELNSTESTITPVINSKSVIARFCFDTPVGPRKLVWTQGTHPWNLVSSFCQKFKITNPNYLEALVHYVVHHSGQTALQS